MKKLIVVCLVIAMAACMSISVLAANGGFLSSPSANSAPELVEGKNESEDCESQLVVTSYANRDQLSEEARKAIEEAYSQIIGTQDLSSLNQAIKALAEELDMDPSKLAVSDLFDISASDCDGHENHGHFDITLKAETLKNFAFLLHYYNGEWHIVEGAKVTNNGAHLEFEEDQFSPFAIVVYTGETVVEPEPAPNNTVWVVVGVAAAVVVVGGAAAFLTIKFKKKA